MADAEGPGQQGNEPAGLVAKEVLRQRARVGHAYPPSSRISITLSPGHSRAIATAAS